MSTEQELATISQIRFHEVPILAREARSWPDLTVEWERVAPFNLEAGSSHLHRIILILRNTRIFRSEGGITREGIFESGDLSIAPAGHAVGYRWNTEIEILSLFLEPSFLEGVAAQTLGSQGGQIELLREHRTRDPLIFAIAQALRAETAQEGAGSRLVVDSLTQALAVHLLRKHTSRDLTVPQVRGGLPRWRLKRALDFIEANLSNNPSLAELAKAAGDISQFHFARLFKQSTGHAPHQYMLHKRIRLAQTMLHREKALSLGEIAFACGFPDQSSFSRIFRQVSGCTPKRYRDQS